MARYGIRDIMNVTIKDFTTGAPVLYLSSLKSSSLESKAETVYARGGRGNPKLLAWDGSRDETFAFEDALVSPEGLGLLFGATPTTGAVTVNTTKVFTVSASNTITLDHTPLGTNGALKWFYTTTDGASLGVQQTYSATPATGMYQISGTTVTFYTDIAEGSLIVANYSYTSTSSAKTVTIDATKFPGTYQITGECFFRLESGVDVPANFNILKAKILPGFTITMKPDGDASVFNFSAEVLRGVGTDNMVKINILE